MIMTSESWHFVQTSCLVLFFHVQPSIKQLLFQSFLLNIIQVPKVLQQHNKMTFLRLTAILMTLCLSQLGSVSGVEDNEHSKALKDFVPDHPHLHELVDKTHAGDLDAKHRYERESLSVRFNSTRSKLPAYIDEEHVVLHFLDDYTTHVTGGKSDHKFMELEPFINMLSKEDDLKLKLVELGKLLERAECDFSCLGDHLTNFMNESFERLTQRVEL